MDYYNNFINYDWDRNDPRKITTWCRKNNIQSDQLTEEQLEMIRNSDILIDDDLEGVNKEQFEFLRKAISKWYDENVKFNE